jgi:hypothetical protein
MATIDIYSDDTRCNKNTFRINVAVWGIPEVYALYKSEVQTIIDANLSILGKDFKGFHSYNLNDKNWTTVGKVYNQVLENFIRHVRLGDLHFLIRLESEDIYEANAGYLKNVAKINMEKRESDFGRIFKSLAKNDLPAFYHRADQLFIYLRYRDKFGNDGDEFRLYPDSIGKILRYDGIEFEVSGDIFKDYPLDFYDLIRIWGNSLAKTIKAEGWPTKDQQLVKFQPLKSTEDVIIQTCDIVANFFFNFLRFQVGIADPKVKLKSDAISKFIDFSEHSEAVKSSFSERHGEVICRAKKIKVCIEIV